MRKVQKRSLTPFGNSNRPGIRPPAGQAATRQPSGVVIVPPAEEERVKMDTEMQKYIQEKKRLIKKDLRI
ncbi:hypothetical protein [Saccharibacillus kuerlensis]|uniref:Uncharacterized protein n=1 Tax=Saccharibacillus kuerlensis TaxID=459527 RepID=A0ABQ2L0I6_9BACL|nr:hypothetical protein [Saccharibacillus kuerlensis]GGN98523.1 hypothetical protein GCM10010969_17750 [Saccharibacillus kuerlensis]